MLRGKVAGFTFESLQILLLWNLALIHLAQTMVLCVCVCVCVCDLRAFRLPSLNSSLPNKLYKSSWSWPFPALPLSLHIATFPFQQNWNRCWELLLVLCGLSPLFLYCSFPLPLGFSLLGPTSVLGVFRFPPDAPFWAHCVLSPLGITSVLYDFSDCLSVNNPQT